MPFLHAKKKNLPALQEALGDSVEVNQRDGEGATVLLYACEHSYGCSPSGAMARWLIARGAEVNVKSRRGFTPLTMACSYGSYEVALCLLEAGASPNVPGEQGITPLMAAATSGYWSDDGERLVALLLAHGANPNALDDAQNNALLRLIDREYRLPIARLLIDAGTDVNHQGSYGRVALTTAAEAGRVALVRLLLKSGARREHARERGVTALVKAMQRDRKDVVVCLLEHGARRPEGQDLYGSSLIAYAAAHGYIDLLDRLGTDTPARLVQDAVGQAARSGQVAFLQAMVQRGLTIRPAEDGPESPLMQAARCGSIGAAQLLLEHGARLEGRDWDGNTALQMAAWSSKAELAEFLLQQGADVNTQNKQAYTPLFQAALRGCTETVRVLLAHGASVNIREREHGATPLMLASAEGKDDVVQILLEAGADLHAVADNGRTSWSWARGTGRGATAALLKQAGAKSRARTTPPSPLHCAFCANELSASTAKQNHCTDCDAAFCDRHFPFSDWAQGHVTENYASRTAICPYGHRKVEYSG